MFSGLFFHAISVTVFIAVNGLCIGLALVFFLISLVLKRKYSWRKSGSNLKLAKAEMVDKIEEAEFLLTESVDSNSGNSKSSHHAIIAADSLTAFFFSWFLITFSTWSYIPWFVAGTLVAVFLVVFLGLWATDFFARLAQYRRMKGHGENAIAAQKTFVKQAIPLAVVILTGFLFAGMTSDVCIAFEPMQFTSAFSRMFYNDPCAGAAPCFVYLTLGNNASSQLIIHFQAGSIYDRPTVRFDTQPRSEISSYANKVSASVYHMTRITELTRAVYYGFLNNLAPNTTYYFVAGNGDDVDSYSTERKVRTAPLGAGFTFVTGGDMGAKPSVEEMTKMAASNELLFAAVGGDITYENGMVTCYPRWDWWFSMWSRLMITPAGYTVPLVTAIGNHEAGAFQQTGDRIGSYRQFFVHEELNGRSPLELKTYHSHIIGNLLLLSLDSWVLEAPYGEQLEWMARQFDSVPLSVKFTSALYHAPMYPSASSRAFDAEPATTLRQYWEPLFSKYNMTVGFENHDHAFKRTKPIYEGKVANDTARGVVYVGDGSWGVTSRPPRERWYLEDVKQATFVLLVDVAENDVRIKALDVTNTIIADFSVN